MPPDREHPSQNVGHGNPFDTGLPMLRIPAGKPSKRRRPHGRRKVIRRREPEFAAAEPPRAPDKQSTRPQFGEWEQWLEPASPAEQQPEPPVQQRSAPPEPEPPAVEQSNGKMPAIINRSGVHPGNPVRHPRRQADQPRRNWSLTVLIVLGIAVAAVSIGLTIIYGSDTKTRTAAATSPARSAGSAQSTSTSTTWAKPPWAIATPGCEQRRAPDVVSGTDPGGTGNGPDAILAFEYAYYAERSGYRARAVVAPDAAVAPADQIQRGINHVPVGTRYCVLITRAVNSPAGQERWEVRLTQQLPGEETNTFTQFITTRTGTDQTLITGITAG
ncbi:hypothetical protein OHA40_09340 [Nocardia sp. NBC_00508]|uniref:hypothetical protein n=1 Tax=Nocardia sp. NBC_00508 TaxID=2975992 RepID=UPI002E805819|nr:hypothetical protein [Nocardia sp. NBC_00508]WUD68291.1 hypothetical protein OHA40_09340 [Nocardia sp. NBC_00508]